MKKIFLLCAAVLFAVSCDQFKEISDVQDVAPISVTLQVNLNAQGDVPTPQTYKIKFNNYQDGIELIKEVEADGAITVDNLVPGVYTINVSAQASDEHFTYNFNGTISNTYLIDDNKTLPLDIAAAKSGNIIFKEIYYCGSRTPKNSSYFRDQYYELYNNSDKVQYLDGLCMGNLYPINATANIPVWDRENQEDYVYFQAIWQIPGDGTQYPLNPGESIIIAQMADNHQKESLNPNSPVNLTGAEFETFLKTTNLISDNPAVNMILASYPSKSNSLTQWLVTVNGGAYAMFYPQEEIDPNTYVIPVGSSTKAKDIPIDWIMDAVELIPSEEKMNLKRVPAVLDAGATFVGSTYCSKSVSRKVKETLADGRIVYMDTNNSSEDFQVNDTPVLRRGGAGVPSWNTWIK